MANENTPDLAEQKRPLDQGVQSFIMQQGQPRSFMEHPATAFIPILGGLFAAIGAMQRRSRQAEASIQASHFDTLVKSGELTPDIAAQLFPNLPLPIIHSGLVESQKVQQTLGYQGRKNLGNFLQSPGYTQAGQDIDTGALPPQGAPVASPSGQEMQRYPTLIPGVGEIDTTNFQSRGTVGEARADALQDWMRKYPEFAAALGAPEVGRIAMEAENQDMLRERIGEGLGVPVRPARGGRKPRTRPQVGGMPAQPQQMPLQQYGMPVQQQGMPTQPTQSPGEGEIHQYI